MIVFGQQKAEILHRKMLIVLNYWDGDLDAATELIDLICDLEPARSEYADFMLFRRNDAQPMHENIRLKLLTKFEKVHSIRCRRLNARGYPYGANEMFYDLLDVMHGPEWVKYYHSFLNLEPDCVPTDPDWIRRLCDEYRALCDQEHYAIGQMNDSPVPHLNGMAIYSTDFWARAGGLSIIGGPAGVAYDICHAKRIVPLAKDSPLIFQEYRRKTIAAEDLFAIKKSGVKPVIVHGVKDGSARCAARAFFVEKRGIVDLSMSTIQSYFDPAGISDVPEHQRQIDIWRDAWKAAGWNPIVNNGFDAARNPRYGTFGDRPRYLRWLAFETNGAGLYADYDVLPRRTFSPAKLGRAEGFNCLQYRDDKDGRPAIPAVVHADRAGIKAWINRLLAAQPEENILESVANEPWFHGREMCRCVGEEGWEGFPIVHFGNEACRAYAPGNLKSAIMLNFVRSVESQ